MEILIILVLIYLISAFFTWLYMHKAFSKNGIWEGVTVNFLNVFFVIMPIINIFIALILWTEESPKIKIYKNKKSGDKFYKWFFHIK